MTLEIFILLPANVLTCCSSDNSSKTPISVINIAVKMSSAIQILYDAKTKKVTLPEGVDFPELQLELDQLNTLTTELISNGNDVPPAPSQESFNKDMSKMIMKMYESGVGSFRKGDFEAAARQFSLGIEMILRRQKFEAFQGTIQELTPFLMSRADAYLKTKQYLKAFNDADLLLNMQINAPDNFLRRGVANYFLGNYEDARADYQRGLAFAENNDRLLSELEICLDKILEENGDKL